MQKLDRKPRSFAVAFAVAALLAAAGVLTAQSGSGQEEKPPEQKREQVRAIPQVTGTVILWNGDRIDLKTRDGKTQKVAVNTDTERLVEIQEGMEVTVDYRRKVGGFVIAERVRPVNDAAAEPSSAAAVQGPSAVTGKVVSWNDAALVLRTGEGDVTLFLSPETEYLVKSLDSGALVTVEYREGSDRAKLATRVLAGKEKSSDQAAKKEDGRE